MKIKVNNDMIGATRADEKHRSKHHSRAWYARKRDAESADEILHLLDEERRSDNRQFNNLEWSSRSFERNDRPSVSGKMYRALDEVSSAIRKNRPHLLVLEVRNELK